MNLLTPYYEEPGITLYHGDCCEILPHLPQVDLVHPEIEERGGVAFARGPKEEER